jgi:serine/threonine protein kinase
MQDTVKICDFGWAVYSNNGMRSTVAGSPLYYSPEVVQESRYDEKIDIWAIGMMIYECLLGKIPFKIYSELDLNRIVVLFRDRFQTRSNSQSTST